MSFKLKVALPSLIIIEEGMSGIEQGFPNPFLRGLSEQPFQENQDTYLGLSRRSSRRLSVEDEKGDMELEASGDTLPGAIPTFLTGRGEAFLDGVKPTAVDLPDGKFHL